MTTYSCSDDCVLAHCCGCGDHLAIGELVTCVRCVASARQDLATVVELAALAATSVSGWPASSGPTPGPRTSDTTVPGGDLLVLVSPGSEARSQATGPTAPHAYDEYPGDPQSVEAVLCSWEDDWRHELGQPPAETSNRRALTDAAAYLDRHIGLVAQRDPAFADYRDKVRELRMRLEASLRTGPQRSPVPCMACGSRTLERVRPRPAETATNRDVEAWKCARCHRRYEDGEYWMAVRHSEEAR